MMFIITLHLQFLTKKTTAGIFWGNIGKTRPFQTGPKDVFHKALVTDFPVPSSSNSGVSGRMMTEGSANNFIRTKNTTAGKWQEYEPYFGT